MAGLEFRLRALFNERSARRLAPASLLAVGCGVALGGMVIGAPALATGVGLVISNIAVNIASSWIERLAMLPVEAEAERIELLEQGLADRDPGALAVVAATLAAAGPQVAAALPDASRDQLAATLGQGMAEAGGPLAALAPAYTAALSDPDHADWTAIRAAANRQIQIVARVQAGERATIARSGISVADTEASVDASVVAGNDAQISDSPISIQGVRQPSAGPGYGISAGAGGTVQDSPLTVINNHMPDPEADRQANDLRAYLRHTLNDCNALPLDKIDQSDTSHTRAMELAHVYIALDTTTMLAEAASDKAEKARPDREPQRPLAALQALAHAPAGRAMLLGAPGSGKSTFVNYLTHCMAGAALAAQRSAEFGPVDAWLAHLPGWSHGALLPVPIILRDLAALPEVAVARTGTTALIHAYLQSRASELGCPHSADPLIAALRDGKALLLLDGLDEVIGTDVLPRVAELIRDAAKTFPGPILVTCRVLDYQEEPLRRVSGFAAYTLAELNPAQIRTFIDAWYRELVASGRRKPAEAAAATQEMQGAVQSRDELRAMAGTPLLLTLMAQVHAFRGTLPDARALLYYACIDLLLIKWRQPRDEPDLIVRLGLSRFRSGDLLALMARLGYEAHELASRSAGQRGAADLPEDVVIKVLTEVFAAYDEGRKFQLAEIVLHALARGNGLLLKRGPQVYTFAHRTFQEFLAGIHLKGLPNPVQHCRERAPLAHWHEALLLLVGYQVLGERELEKPLSLAEKLIKASSPLEQVLAGDIMALVGQERARGFDPGLVARDGLWPGAIKRLRQIQREGAAPSAPATLRHRAGLALGRLCYGELKDLAVPEARLPAPDPRLPLAVLGLPAQSSPNWPQALTRYWCRIEAGLFWSGDDRTEKLKQAQIAQPYQIGRYPVTNADYARFLAANGPAGYAPDKPWWTPHGRTYLLPGGYRFEGEPKQISHPRYWSVVRYNGPLQPVVGVTWYEAAAYCRWLTADGHQAGWLPKDQEIRLPTWLEWQRAARHSDQRRHPWGQEPPDPERANYNGTGISAPSPIGCFPRGAAICGAQDMLGNVLEWTASPDGQFQEFQKDFTRTDGVVMSYTFFNDGTDELFCGARSGYFPFYRVICSSFRVVQSLMALTPPAPLSRSLREQARGEPE